LDATKSGRARVNQTERKNSVEGKGTRAARRGGKREIFRLLRKYGLQAMESGKS